MNKLPKCKCCKERGTPKNNSAIGYYCEKPECQDKRISEALKKVRKSTEAATKKANVAWNVARKRIMPRSEKRSKEERAYLTLREVFLKDKICPITGQPATEIHHKKGRIGKLLCDVKYWLAVSREGHIWIENNPKEAKEKGYSLDRL